ncbi:MAG: peptidylprolyl isomerase [Proteobacteria bacterium]|nr:peptidylprolyl isomerase [Pseudomonadota bacterium]
MQKTILSLGLSILVLFCCLSSAHAEEDIAAIVNGDKITITEINRTVQALPQYQKLQLEILEDMIVKTLIYQESIKDGIVVEKSEVDNGFNEYIEKLSLTDEVVKQEMKRMNITEETMKDEIQKLLMVERFLKKRSKTLNLNVSDEEVKAFYDERPETFNKPERIQVSHILIKSNPGADKADVDAAMKKIVDIQDKLKKGEGTFADIAKKYSEDTSSAPSGGDLKGEITRNSPLPKSFIDAAFALDKGQVSDVVKSVVGFHLIKVTEKKPAEVTAFPEIKDSLKFRLLEQKSNIEMKQYVDSLVDKSDIQIKLEKRPVK